MSDTRTFVLSILSQLFSHWEYAFPLREKILSGVLSDEEIYELAQIFTASLDSLEEEETRLHIENSLFQRFLIGLEEGEVQKQEQEKVDILLNQL